MQRWWPICGLLLMAPSHVVAYNLIHDYSGTNFFEGWNFYGYLDNLTWGASFIAGVGLAVTALIL